MRTLPVLDVRNALMLVLDQVDYMRGACSLTDAVGAALPADVLDIAHATIEAADRAKTGSITDMPLPGENELLAYLTINTLEQLAERGTFPNEYKPYLVEVCRRITGMP
jgi:hypothetical protein